MTDKSKLESVQPEVLPGIDWLSVARHTLESRLLDETEEATNRERAKIPKENVVLYQFSARGHDMAQTILGSLVNGTHDGAGAYYRSRPFLLALGLSLEDALGSPLGRSGGFSDGRDIGVVCNLPSETGPIVLPMAGDVGSQYTPAAGWAQSILYHRDQLGDSSWNGSIAIALGGDASVATSGFWSALTMATTLKLPILFYIEDNNLGISVPGHMQTPGGNIAENLKAFGDLFIRSGSGSNPHEAATVLKECVEYVRNGNGPALARLTVPRLSSHSGPDNQKGYRTEEEISADETRDPLPQLRKYLVPSFLSEKEWRDLEEDVSAKVLNALKRARERAAPDPEKVGKYVFADEYDDGSAFGGLTTKERLALPSNEEASDKEGMVRYAEAIRKTLAHELEVNPKVLVFGEDVGKKGGVHLVTEGLQKRFGERRVFDTSLSEEGIVGRAVGLAISGLMPVAEIQFRKYADPATEQLNNTGTMRWRTANRFCAPMVVRMPGGFGKDVGDPWHSLSDEVRFAHAIGWQVVMPSNSADAVGLLRSAMRSPNPTIFFEHRALLMTGEGSTRYPGDDYVIPIGQARTVLEGNELTLISWGAMLHRCQNAALQTNKSVDLIDLRTISPWDRNTVLQSVKKTGRCLVVHEDNLTAGFGAEIAATIAQEAFWYLDAPVKRMAPADIPIPYHPDLLNAVIPSETDITSAIIEILNT